MFASFNIQNLRKCGLCGVHACLGEAHWPCHDACGVPGMRVEP